MKFVLFVVELGHEELDDIIAALEADWQKFLDDYEQYINDINEAVADLLPMPDTRATSGTV